MNNSLDQHLLTVICVSNLTVNSPKISPSFSAFAIHHHWAKYAFNALLKFVKDKRVTR